MNIHSLLAACLIALFSLSTISAVKPPSSAYPFTGELRTATQSAGTSISLDEYWNLVTVTRRGVTQLEAQPRATIRKELDALATQWEQVTAIEYSDHSLVQIDSSYLVTALRRDPPELKRLGNMLDALLHAHEQYPGKIFTVEDVAPLNKILARPEFQWQQEKPSQTPSWLSDLYKRFVNFITRLLVRTGSLAHEGGSLLKIAAVFILIFSLFFVSRALSHSLVREAQLAAEEGENDELLTSKGAFKRAETLSIQRDYRNAIRYLYISSLLVLDEQGLMRYDRSRTNREYLRSVSSKPELAKPLQDVIDVFDRVWYGFEGVDEKTYQSYVERVDELREKKE